MKLYQHILVGIDFSPACLSACRTAARLASRDGTPVTAVHVVDPRVISSVRISHGTSEGDFLEDSFDRVHSFLAEAGVASTGMTVELEVGHPCLTLRDSCKRHGAGLLVLGTRGSIHGPNQVGTTAAQCVRRAPAEVLLVREGADQGFKHVTACVDFSETSAKAVRSAALVAGREGAELDCLFVIQPALALTADYGGMVPSIPIPPLDTPAILKRELDTFIQSVLGETDQRWTSHVLECFNIRDGLFEYIRKAGTDLVVLGTHGRSNLRTLVMGTTAERIVMHAPCSVFAVKPNGGGYRDPEPKTANLAVA